jgi:hypothetical protein
MLGRENWVAMTDAAISEDFRRRSIAATPAVGASCYSLTPEGVTAGPWLLWSATGSAAPLKGRIGRTEVANFRIAGIR